MFSTVVETGAMKHFMDRQDTLVQDAIEGLLATSEGRLTRLDGFPHIKVVLRADWDKSQVAVISGGGSGHEPAHAGFVGRGLLTAAVCGEVFASPSVEAVLAAIRAVTGAAGCLLIVKNYTGDRLNFGLAAERARAEGLLVRVVVVGDDISLPEADQPRGIAGTLFVHKIAGFLAEQGESLDRVFQGAAEVAGTVKSFGLALTTCHPPGVTDKDDIGAEQVELGLGIHGESGVERISMAPGTELMELVCGPLADSVGDGRLAVILNNLGAVPPIEMSFLTRAFLNSSLGTRTEILLGPAHLMTSCDMNGFSISVLPLSDQIREALNGPVELDSWPRVVNPSEVRLSTVVESPPPEFEPTSDPRVRAALLSICRALKNGCAKLNELDAKVGDGDSGDTFYAGAAALEEEIDNLPLADPKQLLSAISQLLGRSMGAPVGLCSQSLLRRHQ